MVGGPKVIIVSVRVLYVSFMQVYGGWDTNKSFLVVGGPKVIIVSAHILYVRTEDRQGRAV